jgi:hypothetical protein
MLLVLGQRVNEREDRLVRRRAGLLEHVPSSLASYAHLNPGRATA